MPTYGIIFHPQFPPETLSDYARRAEAAGFDELWLWDDCFLPGAFTSAAIALAATQKLKVGIGLLPATAYNPLFATMEITTLARAYPDRILPGFGHGVSSWMKQIGAAPKSSMTALHETVETVRRLLTGEKITIQGEINLDQVQMNLTPQNIPPLYVGAMREKSLQLAGRIGDGTLLTAMSSPEYVRWARSHIQIGMNQAHRSNHRVVVYVDVKVNPDRSIARTAARRALADRLPWADVQLSTIGLAEEVAAFTAARSIDQVAEQMPDAWLDRFAAAGSPVEVLERLQHLAEAGADSIVFQPLNGDPDCLAEYDRYLMQKLKSVK